MRHLLRRTFGLGLWFAMRGLVERPRETAETQHTSPQPSWHIQRKGAAPLRGTEEQTARAISAYMRSTLLTFFANGECRVDCILTKVQL